jgi:hypothetical protein
MKVFKKHSNIFITILLFSSLIIITYFNYKTKEDLYKEEDFHDCSSNKVDASSNKVDASSNKVDTKAPAWNSPEATTEDVVYTILLIICPVISVLSLVFFIYTYTTNNPSYVAAVISLCFLIFFMMLYFNKYT